MDDKDKKELMYEELQNLKEEFTVSNVLDGILSLCDIKKMLKYDQILVEKIAENVMITGYDGDRHASEVIDIDDCYSREEENEKNISAMCGIAYTIKSYLDLDNNKYANFRFTCGMESNSDKEYEKESGAVKKSLEESTDGNFNVDIPEFKNKLYAAGYEIIKRCD